MSGINPFGIVKGYFEEISIGIVLRTDVRICELIFEREKNLRRNLCENFVRIVKTNP